MTSSKIKGETVPHLVRIIPLVHSSRADVEHGCPELRPRQAFPCLGLRARLGQPEIFQPPLEYWTCRTHSKCGVSKNLVIHHPSPTTTCTLRESPSEYHQLSITGSGCESHVGVEAGHPDLVVLDQDAAVESLKNSKSGLANLSARYPTVAGSDFSHTAEESRANLD